MAERRVAVLKRISLAEMSHGWTDECYALMRPADYTDMQEVQKYDQSTPADKQWEFQKKFLEDHFVGGKIMVLNEKNEPVLDDMRAEDTVVTIEVANKLFAECIGFDLDPKDLSAAALTSAVQQKSATSTE